MERVKRLIHTDYAYKMGLSGKNVTVAVMDTGVAPHPDLEGRILAFKDFFRKERVHMMITGMEPIFRALLRETEKCQKGDVTAGLRRAVIW